MNMKSCKLFIIGLAVYFGGVLIMCSDVIARVAGTFFVIGALFILIGLAIMIEDYKKDKKKIKIETVE